MKLRLAFATLLFVGVLATSVCRKTESDTARLEELPKEIAASLQRLPNSDLLVSMPPMQISTPAAKQQEPVTPVVNPPAIKCSTTYRFLVQVDYPVPVTVCSTIQNLNALTVYDAAVSPGPRPAPKRYKLTSFQGRALGNPLVCQFRQGPWLATIAKNVDCSSHEHCDMVIAVPWSPIFHWDGRNCQVENRPPSVQYIDPTVDAGIISSSSCNAINQCP
jgi:hypothetical protein